MTASAVALNKNAIGLWQIVFFVIAAAAPLTRMLGIIPVAIRLGNGARGGSANGLVLSFPWMMFAVLLFGVAGGWKVLRKVEPRVV